MAKASEEEEKKKDALRFENLRQAVIIALALWLLFSSFAITVSLDDDWAMNGDPAVYVILFGFIILTSIMILCCYFMKDECGFVASDFKEPLFDSPSDYASIVIEPYPFVTPPPLAPGCTLLM
ncbi:uncharacterized protein [Rhodnius prolixus]|uniref:Uncharacterized protein n=1 Tax=Rhodnius prolixus TaxID=13249 RepID=T1HWH1_RHOPR